MVRYTIAFLAIGIAISQTSILSCVLAQQPSAEPAAAKKKMAPPKFSTPTACFEALVEASKGNEPAALLPCFSEAMRNHLLGTMAFNLERFGALSDGGEASVACQKVLKAHGLYQKDLMGFLQVVDSPVGGGAIPGFIQIGDSIKDKHAFFIEGTAAMKEVQKALDEFRAKDRGEKVDQPANAADKQKPAVTKLEDVKVTGETASGKVIVVGAEDKSEEMFFKLENGSWVITMGSKEPDWKQPIQGRFRFSDYLKQLPK